MEQVYYGTGKRKIAVARVWLKPGSGNITVNNRKLTEYFTVYANEMAVKNPLMITNRLDQYDVTATVKGGGVSGQAEAVRHGISKALLQLDPNLRPILKRVGFITRDPRLKERKKYGQKAARKRFQFSKR